MLELPIRRGGQKALGHQPLQLLRGVQRGFSGVFAVLDLSLRHGKLGQNAGCQTRYFAGNQGEAPAPVVNALLEVGFVGRQRLQQKSPVQRHVNDLLAQLFERAAA